MHRLLTTYIAFSFYLFAEPSAFSAGDLTVDEPYGLTPNEKLLLKNIDKVKHLNRDKNVMHSDVDQLKNDLDGLRSVMNGVSLKQQKSQKLLKKILETQDDLEVASLEYKTKIATLDSNLTTLVDLQNKNYKKIQENFTDFDKRLLHIEKNYVSKKSFDALQAELTQLRALITTQFKKLNKTSKKTVTQSGKTLFAEGKAALKAKKYKTAATRFTTCIEKKYKPATSHFYAGEAYYQQKRYSKAVSYFKESYRRYKKGSYNAKLFLHMAISLDKLGKKSQAKKVFKTVIKKYPGTVYAKKAKEYL